MFWLFTDWCGSCAGWLVDMWLGMFGCTMLELVLGEPERYIPRDNNDHPVSKVLSTTGRARSFLGGVIAMVSSWACYPRNF